MTIYEIDKAIEEFLNSHIDPDTGEITDIEELDELQLLRTEKIENIALYYKNVRATTEAVKAERKNLEERQRSLEKKAESLQKLIEAVTDGNRFETGKVSITYRNSSQVIVERPERLPGEYKRYKYEVQPDKAAIKKALQEGIEIYGCHIETKRNIQVK